MLDHPYSDEDADGVLFDEEDCSRRKTIEMDAAKVTKLLQDKLKRTGNDGGFSATSPTCPTIGTSYKSGTIGGTTKGFCSSISSMHSAKWSKRPSLSRKTCSKKHFMFQLINKYFLTHKNLTELCLYNL